MRFLLQHLKRWLRPPRTLHPTREGWWFLLTTVGLGVAASNTGNNLLYLLVSTLLGLIVVSGILSEQSLRRLRLERITPREIFARQPALLGLLLANRKRWFSSHSVAVECAGVADEHARILYIPALAPSREALLTVEEQFPRRGRQMLPSVRVMTRFPFGLFLKISRPIPGPEVLVYPEVRALTPADLEGLGSDGSEPQRQVGPGAELHNLRDYRWGDDPRLIHWKSSAKVETLMIRELEAETAHAVRLELEPSPGPLDPERLEAALSRAASLAVHLLEEGTRVGLRGPNLHVPLGEGPAHRARILDALALFDPGAAPLGPQDTGASTPIEPGVRVVRIPLGGPAAS